MTKPDQLQLFNRSHKDKTQKAQFSIDGLKGLLTKYDIIVE
jgi:hypothetical protein